MSLPQDRTGKVLIFSGVRGDTRRYRTLHLYEQLRLAGADCVLSHLTDPKLFEYTRQASVAVLHRVAFDGHVEKLIRSLHAQNALIVLDADDFLYDPAIMRWIDSPDFQDPIRAALYRKELLRHRATLDHCDALTVSTNYLGRMMEPFGKPVYVHRNAYSLEMLALSEQAVTKRLANRAANRQPSAERVVIGYASGTRTHDQDFALVRPVLLDLLHKYPQVELWLMGAIDNTQSWSGISGQVRWFPLVPWRMLPAQLAQLDINLAPLVPQSPFNEAKSEIKYMEAALVRVPTVASPTDAFQYAIRAGQNGFLASSPEEWRAALETLIQNPDARRTIGEAAYQEVCEGYSPEKRGQDFIQELITLADARKIPLALPVRKTIRAGETQPVQPLFSVADEEHPSMVELARYSVLHRGLGTLLGQVWVYFRRKLAPVFPFRKTGVV